MAIIPKNSHFNQQWSLRAIRAPEAWQVLRDFAQSLGRNLGDPNDLTFGSADIILAVLDTGAETNGGQPVHAAFQGNVTSSQPKGLAFYDFSRFAVDVVDNKRKFIFNNNDAIRGAHGSQCAGVAVAGARLPPHPKYASESAIVGVAPNCRLISLIRGAGSGFAFYWAANMGIDYDFFARWEELVPAGAAYRLPAGTRTDIISLSIGIPDFQNVGFNCAAFGRNGRGVTICLASGNDNTRVEGSITDRVIIVGATQISDDGTLTSEMRASYSNYGRRVDLCAPAGGAQEDAGVNLRLTNTAVPEDCGTFDSVDSVADWNITIKISSQKTEYTVQEPMPGIFAGQYISIGDPSLNTYQVRRITVVDTANKKITIEKKFNGTGLDLSNTAARIPYQFAVTSAAASGNAISFATSDMKRFAAGQDIYIFDAADPFLGEHARIKKLVSSTQVELFASLGTAYSVGARVVVGNHKVAVIAPGVVETTEETTTFKVGSTDGLFVSQMVRVTGDITTPAVHVDAIDKSGSKVTLHFALRSSSSGPAPLNLNIETLGGGEYTSEFNGTSAAAPVVAGAAALVLSANPDLNWVEVRHILRGTASKIQLTGGKWVDEQDRGVFNSWGTFAQDSPATVLTAQAAAGTTTIEVGDPANLADEVVVRLSGGSDPEFAVVLAVSGDRVTLDRPLMHSYNIGDTVKVGRKAHRSDRYGRGRIDLERSVVMARDWDVNAHDLWIRASLDDITGERPVDPGTIDSPDIWVRTSKPSEDGAAAIPTGSDPGPHQLPIAGQSAWVYVRIFNRGTQPSLPGMEIVLTYTETEDPTIPIQFPFPDKWQPRSRSGAPFAERTIPLTPVESKLLLPPDFKYTNGISYASDPSLKPLFQDNPSAPKALGYVIDKPYLIPSIPGGQSHIAIFPWRSADIPQKPTGRNFLKVHISPFDGDATVAGVQVYTNNNLTFKEIFFRGVFLLDGSGNAELTQVRVTPATQVVPFKLEIHQIPVTAIFQIDITATATLADGNVLPPKSFTNPTAAPGGWSFAEGAPSWLSLNQPTHSGSGPATLQALTLFTGNLIVDNTFAEVELRIVVTDGAATVLDHTTVVRIKAELPHNGGGLAGVENVIFRTFTDWDLLPDQSGATNYGPLPAPDQQTRYRTAAMFSGIASGGSQLKAFAVTSGHAFLQEITGNNTQLNLVLRPEEQMSTPFGPVKYFVYRGLQKASFLDPGSAAVKGDLPASNNELLNRYWVVRNALNDEEQLLDPAFVRLDVARDDLGLTTSPNPPLPADMPIAEVFDRYNRFPLITRGMWIGDFEHTSSYGFEIIVDGPGPEPTLGDVRTLDHTIDITYAAGQPQFGNGAEDDIATKLQRERILGYIDPAAFIGLLVGGKVERSAGTGFATLHSIHDIYDKVLKKFATKDTVYVDIRNELNQSLNFYGNYGDGTPLNTAQLQLQDASGTMAARSYHHHGWPILALRAGIDFPANGTADKLPIRLALPAGDNGDPVLYLAGAAFHLDFPDHTRKYALLTSVPGPGALTSSVDIGLYNDKTESVVMPAALKIALCRRYQGPTNPVFPAGRVLKDDLLDTLLSPLAPPLPPPMPGTTAWDTFSELRYNGWTSHTGFDFTMRTGRALDDFGEVVFAFVQGPAEIHGGTSQLAAHASIDKNKGRDKARSFYEHLQRAGLVFVTTITTNLGSPVPALLIQSIHDNYSINAFEKSADDLVSIAYSASEANGIRSAATAANFLAGAPQYFMAINHLMTMDGEQYPFLVMDLGLEGVVYNGVDNTFEIAQVNTGVKVYSFDGRNYFSAAYTNAVAPLLPFPG